MDGQKKMTYFKTFLAIILLSSCSASWHMKTAIRKDPTIIVSDTIVKYDTVFVEVSKVDTVFRYKFDTVTYWQDKTFIKYHYDTLTNDVFIEVDCPDNEIITKTETITETITIKPTFWEKMQWFAYIAIGLIVFMGIRKVFFK